MYATAESRIDDNCRWSWNKESVFLRINRTTSRMQEDAREEKRKMINIRLSRPTD